MFGQTALHKVLLAGGEGRRGRERAREERRQKREQSQEKRSVKTEDEKREKREEVSSELVGPILFPRSLSRPHLPLHRLDRKEERPLDAGAWKS